MTNTDLALLEVGNWIVYGETTRECAAEASACIQEFAKQGAANFDESSIILMPRGDGGALLAFVSPYAICRLDFNPRGRCIHSQWTSEGCTTE